MAKSNKQYEAMFLVGPAAATDQEAGINLCRQIVERHGGQILVIKRWDERKLAYEMGKQKRGTYVIAYFTAPGSAVSAIERDVNLSEDVLRVMVTSADHLNQQEMEAVEPQPIQPREERNPWDRPSFGGGDRGGDRDRREDRGPRGPRREEGEPAGATSAGAAGAGERE
jgi:small subunit ribosomal protein S6